MYTSAAYPRNNVDGAEKTRRAISKHDSHADHNVDDDRNYAEAIIM